MARAPLSGNSDVAEAVVLEVFTQEAARFSISEGIFRGKKGRLVGVLPRHRSQSGHSAGVLSRGPKRAWAVAVWAV